MKYKLTYLQNSFLPYIIYRCNARQNLFKERFLKSAAILPLASGGMSGSAKEQNGLFI